MQRSTYLFLIAVAGCSPPDASPPTSISAPPAVVNVDLEKLDFKKWPSATKQSIAVDPRVFAPCAAAPSPDQQRETEKKMKQYGPHYKPAIIVRTNPEAGEAFKATEKRLPAGTVIIKEKHTDSIALGPPAEFGVMIKREAGFDPDHGDWEFAFVENAAVRKVTRGKLESCINCHATQSTNDYLFRTYLVKK